MPKGARPTSDRREFELCSPSSYRRADLRRGDVVHRIGDAEAEPPRTELAINLDVVLFRFRIGDAVPWEERPPRRAILGAFDTEDRRVIVGDSERHDGLAPLEARRLRLDVGRRVVDLERGAVGFTGESGISGVGRRIGRDDADEIGAVRYGGGVPYQNRVGDILSEHLPRRL